MKNSKKEFDDTKLVDSICKLKSYINIIDTFIENHIKEQTFIDIGLLIDNMSEIIDDLAKEYSIN